MTDDEIFEMTREELQVHTEEYAAQVLVDNTRLRAEVERLAKLYRKREAEHGRKQRVIPDSAVDTWAWHLSACVFCNELASALEAAITCGRLPGRAGDERK